MGKKKPRHKENPPDKKKPRIAQEPDKVGEMKIVWHVGIADKDGEWGWRKVDPCFFLDYIMDKMANFETMTWGDIFKQYVRHHDIKIESLSDEAKKRLVEINQDDIDSVFSLAMSGKERLIGIRDRHIFKILWWDPNHKVCISKKK